MRPHDIIRIFKFIGLVITCSIPVKSYVPILNSTEHGNHVIAGTFDVHFSNVIHTFGIAVM